MKICITSTGNNLDSTVDPRFGRCAYFIFVDTNDLSFEALTNPNLSAAGGAGIQSAQLVAQKGAEAIVTGNVGPNAFQTLSSLNIKIFTGASGTIKEAIQGYKEGKFKATNNPTSPPKHQ